MSTPYFSPSIKQPCYSTVRTFTFFFLLPNSADFRGPKRHQHRFALPGEPNTAQVQLCRFCEVLAHQKTSYATVSGNRTLLLCNPSPLSHTFFSLSFFPPSQPVLISLLLFFSYGFLERDKKSCQV